MYKNGDLLKNVEKLKIELKGIKYPDKIEFELLTDGNPLMFLPILHYVLLSYSKYVAQFLLDNDYELFSKSDKDFINKVFKAMIYLFNYKPTLNPRQFFCSGYTEAKVIFCLEVIRIVKLEHNNLIKKAYSVNVLKANKSSAKLKIANDSFASLKQENKSESLINKFNSNNTLNKVRVVNHSIEKHTINISPNRNNNFDNEMNLYNQLASPKFNDDENINYNNRYKFNKEFAKVNKLNFDQNDEENYEEKETRIQKPPTEEINIDEYKQEEDVLFNHSEEDIKNLDDFVTNEEEKRTIKQPQLTPPVRSVHNSNSNKQTVDFSQMVDVIKNLTFSVKEMTGRMDSFKKSIEEKVNKMEAEISLLKNKVNILEANTMSSNQHFHNKSITMNETVNQNENNDYIFSFANDHHSISQINSHKENIREGHVQNKHNSLIENVKYDTMKNKKSLYNLPNSNPTIENRPSTASSFPNKISSKIMNEIEDTDSIIERVANRFKETQKLLDEFK